ncbi:hypothetical protein LZ31DRAFT_168967 [Colletotrichum somersetense]|nr:hypothetical protein LZ31DRAFT_168967 [Colletotrichum somersetense]
MRGAYLPTYLPTYLPIYLSTYYLLPTQCLSIRPSVWCSPRFLPFALRRNTKPRRPALLAPLSFAAAPPRPSSLLLPPSTTTTTTTGHSTNPSSSHRYSSSPDTHRRLLNLLPPAQLGSTRLDSTQLASPPIACLAVSTPATYTTSLAFPCSAASTTYAAWKHPDTHTLS